MVELRRYRTDPAEIILNSGENRVLIDHTFSVQPRRRRRHDSLQHPPTTMFNKESTACKIFKQLKILWSRFHVSLTRIALASIRLKARPTRTKSPSRRDSDQVVKLKETIPVGHRFQEQLLGKFLVVIKVAGV